MWSCDRWHILLVKRTCGKDTMHKLCFYGESGNGKSTANNRCQEYCKRVNLSCEVIKLAAPLYALQREIYATSGVKIDLYDQDQSLLEFLAKNMRRINSMSLVENFEKSLQNSSAQVIVCDDLRDVHCDYPYLKSMDFKFIRITTKPSIRQQRLSDRGDINVVINSKTTSELDQIASDYHIHNDDSLENYHEKLDVVFKSLLS